MTLESPISTEKETKAQNTPTAKRGSGPKQRWRLKYGFPLVICVLLVALVVAYFADRVFIIVPPGQVMIVYYLFFGGTRSNQIRREGFHIVAPWDRVYRYNVRSQTVQQSVKVLSRDGLEISLDAIIRFRLIPEMVPYLHRQFGPNYVKNVVTPELEQTVQQVIGTFSAEDIYSFQREASIDQILSKSQRMAANAFTAVDRVSLINVKLPKKMQSAVQSKLEEEQKALAYEFRLQGEQKEAERKRLEVEGYQNYEKLTKLSPSLLALKGIEATLELAKSPNTKVIVMGSQGNLPLLLGNVPDASTK